MAGIETTARVEPLSGQDLELAKADATEPAEGRAVRVDLGDGEPWIIQIKTRRTGLWRARELEAIFTGAATKRMTKRPARFPPPAEFLEKSPSARFLFVTDGAVARDAEWFACDDDSWAASERGTDTTLPPTLSKFKQRVAILRMRAFRHLAHDARVILAEELGMSPGKADECFRALVERVREALLDERRGTISASEGRALADGYRVMLGDGPDGFVPPSCWSAVREQLARDKAIVLVGEAGTGKSLAAAALARSYAKARPLYEQAIFTARNDPKAFAAFWAPAGLSHRVAWVDDPFGKDELAPLEDRTAWARALEGARPTASRVLIVTSRLTFLREVEELLPKLRQRLFEFDAPFDAEGRIALLAAKIGGQPDLTDAERGELLAQATRIATHLHRAISIDLLPTKYLEHRGVSSARERLERAIADADTAGMGKDFSVFFERQRDPIRRGAYVGGWLLELGTSAERLPELVAAVSRDLATAGFELDAPRAIELMRERRWLRKRPEARDEALHSTHVAACRDLSRDDRPSSVAIARAVLEGRRNAKDRITSTANLARILLEQPHLEVVPVVEPMRAAARAAVTARPAAKAFTRALRFLATAGDAGTPVDLVAMALEARVTHDDDRWFVRGFQEWKRPAWTEATYAAVKANEDVNALAATYVEERVASLPMTFVSERELVDFLYEIADVAPAFLELLPRFAELGWQAEAPAYGIARATGDLDALVRHVVAIVEAVESEPDEPYDEDNDAEIEHLSEFYRERLVPAEQLASAIVRVAPPEFLLGRSEPLLFERFGKLVGRLPTDDPRRAPDHVRQVIACCPPDALAELTSGLAEHDHTFALALDALGRLPSSEWDRVTNHLFGRGRDDRGSIVARWLADSFLPNARPRDRVRALAELRVGIGPDDLRGLVDRFSSAERDAYLAIADESGTLRASAEALALLLEVVRAPEPGVAGLTVLAAAEIDVRQEIERFARSPYINPATAALSAARHLELVERAPLALLGLAHRRALVRKEAALLATGVPDGTVREKLGEFVATDPTPSVRIAAVHAIAAIADEVALRTLERALGDKTDTSEAARRGFQAPGDDETDPEYGVADAAREALEPFDRWPEDLREQARALAAAFDAERGRSSNARLAAGAGDEVPSTG